MRSEIKNLFEKRKNTIVRDPILDMSNYKHSNCRQTHNKHMCAHVAAVDISHHYYSLDARVRIHTRSRARTAHNAHTTRAAASTQRDKDIK